MTQSSVHEPPDRALTSGWPTESVRLALGVALVTGSSLLVRFRPMRQLEWDIFKLINALPDEAERPLWVVMQMGSYAAVWGSAALAWLAGRRRLARDLWVVGSLAYWGAKLLKRMIHRERPFRLVEWALVRGHEASGLGFPSGHSAVAGALATAADPHLSRPARLLVWTMAWLTGLARVFVGAHLPDDVTGGLSLGWMLGTGWHLLVGTRDELS